MNTQLKERAEAIAGTCLKEKGAWHCVYCGKEVAEQHSVCCGEVGHTEQQVADDDANQAFVQCQECQDRHYGNQVKAINIEESFEGYDVLTYICPVTNKRTKATVYRCR